MYTGSRGTLAFKASTAVPVSTWAIRSGWCRVPSGKIASTLPSRRVRRHWRMAARSELCRSTVIMCRRFSSSLAISLFLVSSFFPTNRYSYFLQG